MNNQRIRKIIDGMDRFSGPGPKSNLCNRDSAVNEYFFIYINAFFKTKILG
jgi:hypothetical protein